jgi:hypothetical protein
LDTRAAVPNIDVTFTPLGLLFCGGTRLIFPWVMEGYFKDIVAGVKIDDVGDDVC